MIGTRIGIYSGKVAGYDPDAQAFFARVTSAGGSLSTTEQDAVNQLVLDLKSYGIWTLMKAIYPMVGASAASCAQNLVSSSFTGIFTSGWTFTSDGIKGNGTSAYMDTQFVPSTELTPSNQSYAIYKGEITSSTTAEFGTLNSAYEGIILYLNNGWGTINEFIPNNPFTATTARGLQIISRADSLVKKRFSNNVLESKNSSAVVRALGSMILGARRVNLSFDSFTATKTSYFSIGESFTNTNASDYYTAVQAFQTSLSRNF